MNAVTHRRGFTLTELLVTVAIILGLMTLIGGAVSAARGSQKKQATQSLINRLNVILQQQYSTYASRLVTSATTPALRGEALRKMVTADMPDNWADVRAIASGTVRLLPSGTATFPLNATQRAYASYFNSVTPSADLEDAECLFMIVMMGGIADCLDCGSLSLADKGDNDGDNAEEFHDAWGNPIRFVLWPAGLELPVGSGTRFFSVTAPFSSGSSIAAPGGVMRPLIFSAGPDGLATIGVAQSSHLVTGSNCGNPAFPPVLQFGSFLPPASDPADRRADNLTNFDDEAKP